jgi:DNA-binding protein Fis
MIPAGADWTSAKMLTLSEVCDKHIEWVLERCGGNCTTAAKLLGIGKTSVYRYLERVGRRKK